MQKHVNLVDLDKSFRTNIFLQNLVSIQKRTSPIKFAHLAEKSGNGSISNLSTKARAVRVQPREPGEVLRVPELLDRLRHVDAEVHGDDDVQHGPERDKEGWHRHALHKVEVTA